MDHASPGRPDLKALNIPSMDEAAHLLQHRRPGCPTSTGYFPYNLFRSPASPKASPAAFRDGTQANAKPWESAKRTVPLAKAFMGNTRKGRRGVTRTGRRSAKIAPSCMRLRCVRRSCAI